MGCQRRGWHTVVHLQLSVSPRALRRGAATPPHTPGGTPIPCCACWQERRGTHRPHLRRLTPPTGVPGHLYELSRALRRLPGVGLRQATRASVVQTRLAPIRWLAMPVVPCRSRAVPWQGGQCRTWIPMLRRVRVGELALALGAGGAAPPVRIPASYASGASGSKTPSPSSSSAPASSSFYRIHDKVFLDKRTWDGL